MMPFLALSVIPARHHMNHSKGSLDYDIEILIDYFISVKQRWRLSLQVRRSPLV